VTRLVVTSAKQFGVRELSADEVAAMDQRIAIVLDGIPKSTLHVRFDKGKAIVVISPRNGMLENA
jgi:hypothetical protein